MSTAAETSEVIADVVDTQAIAGSVVTDGQNDGQPSETTDDATAGDTNIEGNPNTEINGNEESQQNGNNEEGEARGADNDNSQNGAEQEEEEEEEAEDLFTSLYGEDEELEPEPDIPAPEETSSSDKTSKRRSEEADCFQNKRIKAEPKDAKKEPTETSERRLTTTIEAVAIEEPTAPDIPISSLEFMTYLLELNANELEGNDPNLQRFPMASNLRDISRSLRFENLDEFRKTFIPYIVCDLWQNLRRDYTKRRPNFFEAAKDKRFLSVMTKLKSQRMNNGLEMKCISVIKQRESPSFRFGQLITIQTAVQAQPNSSRHLFSQRRYFAYVTNHQIRNTNNDNQSEVNLLRLLNHNNKDNVYIEEIHFMIKHSDELYLRNDSLLAAEPIACAHNYYMQARAVLKFDNFPIWKQVFSPLFNVKPSGLSININERKFEELKQRNIIQVAMDVVGNTTLSNSFFFALNGSKESQRTLIMSEIVKQLVICRTFKDKKVLFCSSDPKTIKAVQRSLRERRIDSYIVGNGYTEHLKAVSTKWVEHKLEKETDEKWKALYEEMLNHFETNTQLSVEGAVMKYSTIAEKAAMDAMNSRPVIMGRIDDLCNDGMFYKFATKDNSCVFNCCVIEDATAVSEPQLYSLFSFHIKKFLFAGDITLLSDEETSDVRDIFRRYGLSRSFFERYYYLHPESEKSSETTVFNV